MFMVNRPRLLITGGSGLIGSALVENLRTEYATYYTYNTNKMQFPRAFGRKLDLTDEMRMDGVMSDVRPEVLIHAAAMTSVVECERDWEKTYDTNVRATAELLTHCRRFGTRIVYLSTDLVFDGSVGNYEENDETFPVNRYGKSKKLAEELVLDAKYLRPLVLRISLVIGKGNTHHGGMIGWLKDSLEKGQPVTLFVDEYRSMIYLPDLVRIIDEALRKQLEGVYHIAGHKRTSRYDFGVQFAEVFGYDSDLIQRGSLADCQGPNRPADVSLNTRKMEDAFETKTLGLRTSLEHLKDDFKSPQDRGKWKEPTTFLPPMNSS